MLVQSTMEHNKQQRNHTKLVLPSNITNTTPLPNNMLETSIQNPKNITSPTAVSSGDSPIYDQLPPKLPPKPEDIKPPHLPPKPNAPPLPPKDITSPPSVSSGDSPIYDQLPPQLPPKPDYIQPPPLPPKPNAPPLSPKDRKPMPLPRIKHKKPFVKPRTQNTAVRHNDTAKTPYTLSDNNSSPISFSKTVDNAYAITLKSIHYNDISSLMINDIKIYISNLATVSTIDLKIFNSLLSRKNQKNGNKSKTSIPKIDNERNLVYPHQESISLSICDSLSNLNYISLDNPFQIRDKDIIILDIFTLYGYCIEKPSIEENTLLLYKHHSCPRNKTKYTTPSTNFPWNLSSEILQNTDGTTSIHYFIEMYLTSDQYYSPLYINIPMYLGLEKDCICELNYGTFKEKVASMFPSHQDVITNESVMDSISLSLIKPDTLINFHEVFKSKVITFTNEEGEKPCIGNKILDHTAFHLSTFCEPTFETSKDFSLIENSTYLDK